MDDEASYTIAQFCERERLRAAACSTSCNGRVKRLAPSTSAQPFAFHRKRDESGALSARPRLLTKNLNLPRARARAPGSRRGVTINPERSRRT